MQTKPHIAKWMDAQIYIRAVRRGPLAVLLIFAQNNYWGMRNQSSSLHDWISARMHIECLLCVCICNTYWSDAWGVCALCHYILYSFALACVAAIGRKVTKFGRYYTCFCSTSGRTLSACAGGCHCRVRVSPAADANKQAARCKLISPRRAPASLSFTRLGEMLLLKSIVFCGAL